MSDSILADQIRAFAYERYVQVSPSSEVRIRAGDVHSDLNFDNRIPLVVAALKAKKFREQYNLDLIAVEGRPVSTTTTFMFRRANKSILNGQTLGETWAEVTSLEHGHGGQGWEIGRWLWSPTTSKDGAERYAVMEQPKIGDQVFHLVSGTSRNEPKLRVFYGVSRIAGLAERTTTKPSIPGPWSNAESYFRIPLANFSELATKPNMDLVEAELEDIILSDLIERKKYYPYAKYRNRFRGSEGIYLSKLTFTLAEALRELAISSESIVSERAGQPSSTITITREFAEGERARRESAFFRRNSSLREAAIFKHGLRCKGCNWTLAELYGSLGENYIEIHHLVPLSERSDTFTGQPLLTTVEDVIPLCANCHRMVHRRRPALSIDELQLAITENANRNNR